MNFFGHEGRATDKLETVLIEGRSNRLTTKIDSFQQHNNFLHKSLDFNSSTTYIAIQSASLHAYKVTSRT